ncbi:MAG: fasciclin domain-containing protein [Ferruginibacter sp.]
MKIFNSIKQAGFVGIVSAALFTSCNKAPDPATPLVVAPPTATLSLAALLDSPDSSLTFLKAAVVRAGLLPTLQSTSIRFTLFAPTNDAFIASGISRATINALPVATLTSLLGYHLVPQTIQTSSIPTTFPNLQYPTNVNPNPAASALLRLCTFPSLRGNISWVNNIPITNANIVASNGVLHKVARVVNPPSIFIWNKITADPNLVLLKAAIDRADQDPTAPGFLANVLGNNPNIAIGANFTVFAPDTTAFKGTLSVLSAGALNPSMPNATFAGFIATLPITTVKGIVAYHVLGSRAFSNNFPTTQTNVPTLLNGSVAAHPGLGLKTTLAVVPTFGWASISTTVKGVGNASAATVTSGDNHYINGVLHVVNQVLLPQ